MRILSIALAVLLVLVCDWSAAATQEYFMVSPSPHDEACHCHLGFQSSDEGTPCNLIGEFGGRVVVDVRNQSFAKISRGYWLGKDNDTWVVGMCKFCKSYRSIYLEPFVSLPHTSDSCDYDEQCEANRTGILCSRCVNGTGPSLNSRTYKCVECDPSNIVKYIVIQLVVIFVLFGFVFIFDFSPASGALNALVFFAQIISVSLELDVAISPVGNQTKVGDAVEALYGIWNLHLAHPYINNYCFSNDFEMFDLLATQYLLAFLPLIPAVSFCVIVCCWDRLLNCINKLLANLFGRCPYRPTCQFVKRCIRLDYRRSIRTVIASSLLLSYTKVAITTFDLLNPAYLYNSAGNLSELVLYLDGQVPYFKQHHLPFAIVAIFVLVFFLLGFPAILFFCRYEIPGSKDYETKEMRCHRLSKFLDFCIIEPFQRDFRNRRLENKKNPCVRHSLWKMSIGLHDYRWVAGWYMFLRLAILVSYIFPVSVIDRLLIRQSILIAALMVSILLRPYRHWLHNRLDAFVFILLIFLTQLVMYRYFHTVVDSETDTIILVIQFTCSFIPAVIMAGYFFVKLGYNYYMKTDEMLNWMQDQKDPVPSDKQPANGEPLMTSLKSDIFTRSCDERTVRRRSATPVVDVTGVQPSHRPVHNNLPKMGGLLKVFVKIRSFFCGCEEKEVPVYHEDVEALLETYYVY